MKPRKKKIEEINETEETNINKDIEENIKEEIDKADETIIEKQDNNIQENTSRIEEKITINHNPHILSSQAKKWQEYLKKIGISPQAYLNRYPDHKAKEIIEELLNNKQ